MPAAMRTAQAYLLSVCEDTHIEAEVSTRRYNGTCLGSSYSLTKSFRMRAESFQSMYFTESPVT